MAYDPGRLQARRAAARQQAERRRRALALGALAAVAAVAVAAAAIVVLGGGDGGSTSSAAKSAQAAAPAAALAPGGGSAAALPAKVPPSAPGAHRAPDEAVPILMYHVINKPPAGAPYPDLYVTGSDFAGQMNRLRELGYHAVTQQQLWDAWHEGGLLPSKPVVISFDDGYQGVYKRALPVLRRLGWPGVVNLEVKVLRQPEQGGLTPAMVRGLVRAGWEVDSHTINHVDLTKVSPETARYELSASRAQIRKRFGVPVNFFCYPAGKYDAAVEDLVRQAGYLAATTVDPGLARPDEPYALKRVRIDGVDGVDGFERKLQQAAA
jgi:peptidoglycan/xylan/chitin deacetylase (PgdA/CDA1 family)